MSSLLSHPFHLVDQSPWPLIASMFGFGLAIGLVKFFWLFSYDLLIISLIGMIVLTSQWWRDVSREGTLLGQHSFAVELGLRMGMILFIISEVFFFVSFFWSFFQSSLAPNIELGANWPPMGVSIFDPLSVPLLNSIILLTSGISVTWAHHSLMNGNHKDTSRSLMVTILLGIYFTFLQGFEYLEASFNMADSAYGSTFFIATGFHGLHVIVGTAFLAVTFFRISKGSFSHSHHFGFEAAAWYWHFVDVVWLFLFVSVYWWGGKQL